MNHERAAQIISPSSLRAARDNLRSVLPAIDYVRYRRKISANLTGRRNNADNRMTVTQNPIGNISQMEYQIVDSPFSVKTQKKEISIPAPIEPVRYKLPLKRFQNTEQKPQ